MGTDTETKGNAFSEDGYQFEDKCLWLRFKIWKLKVEINPLVTFASAAGIWIAVIYCMVKPDEALDTLKPWIPWITDVWTWLYIATQNIWFLVILGVGFMKYGNIKLGKDDEKPEYSNASYFCMLFAAGIGIGLFYYGVYEPVFHYRPGHYGNRYYDRYNDNLQAQDAMNITFFHYGIHAWIVYAMVGLVMALASYRFGLNMSIRSCFYPILGDRIYGLAGDLIDTLSCICTMFGVCTSLGLGTVQLNDGLNRMNEDIEMDTTSQVIIIWSITGIATISVVTGIKLGIRRLSEICFLLGMFIFCVVLFYDDTWYLLNVYVQSTGYYIQNIIQLGFHTDAFAQLGTAPDGKENKDWIGGWTVFYWGWWIAWAPFVGMFIAKVSRGRTIRSFIMYTLTLPCVYIFFWFSVFGGVGIKMQRAAEVANLTCESERGGKWARQPATDAKLYLLSCRNETDRWFDVVEQYDGIGDFLSLLSIIGLVLYFVTSSDSGSLVIDSLSANGHPDPPRLQRIFWALTEGACATGLLVAGGEEALAALQATSIAAGLIYTIILNFMAIALWRMVKIDAGELDPKGPQFVIDLLDILYSIRLFLKSVVAVFIPWYFLGIVNSKVSDNKKAFYISSVFMAIIFYGAIVCCFLEFAHDGLFYIGATLYCGFATYIAGIRIHVREMYGINGNMVEDWFAGLLCYPGMAIQLYEHMLYTDLVKKNDDAPDIESNGYASYEIKAIKSDEYENDNGIDNTAYKFDGHVDKDHRLSTHI